MKKLVFVNDAFVASKFKLLSDPNQGAKRGKKILRAFFFSVILNKSLQRTNRSISKEYGINISNDIQISRAKEHILY